MKNNEILDEYYSNLKTVSADGDHEVLLRWTGEQLALAGERLKASSPDDLDARASELLVITRPHVDALHGVGMAGDALATQALALLTALMSKANPEKMPGLYMRSLECLCLCAAMYTSSLQDDRVSQASQIAAQCFGLFVATANSYIPRFGAPDDLRQLCDRLRRQAKQAGEEVTHFRGNVIIPQMAVDILADTLSRLSALGVEF